MKFNKIYKKIVSLILSTALVFSTMVITTPVMAEESGTTYYVDSQAGNDGNSGTSTDAPWKTLNKVTSSNFVPGDKILLKSDCVWNEKFVINFSGDQNNQITIGKYGEGNAPVINGGGGYFAVEIINKQYITLQDIEITNYNPANHDDYKTERHTRSGISIRAYHNGPMNRIQLKNLNIHDVTGQSLGNGNWLPDADGVYSNKNKNAAIIISSWQWEEGTPANKYASFVDMLIEDCYIHDVTTVGINVEGQQPIEEAYNKNLIIRNNTITRTGNDFIVVGTSKNPLIENNTGCDGGVFNEDYTYIAGMWVWNTYGATIQENEVARIHYYNSSVSDSGAFDTDIVTHGNHYYQYNYSHDNTGGFFMSMGQLDNGMNIVRYNISQNDGDNGNNGKTLVLSDPGFFYNNVFYNNTDEGISMTDGEKSTFTNNIFYTTKGNKPFPSNVKFYNNNFYGCIPPTQGINNLTVNPRFIAPGHGEDGMDTIGGYKLQQNSPLLGAGKVVQDNGGRDLWGNTLYNGSPDIGAFEDPTSTVEDTIPPEKPLNLTLKDKTDTTVILSWNAVENNIALDSDIYDANTDTKVASVYGSNTVTISGLTADTEYKYYVISKDSSGNSSPKSDVLTVKTTIASSIIDEADQANVTVSGTWTPSQGDSSYKDRYLKAPAGTGLNSVKWTPDLPVDGYYLVSCWVPNGKPTRATDAKFEVKFDGGVRTYTVNERTAAGGWVQLGIHKFTKGTSGYVQLTDNANGEVAADGIKFMYLEGYSLDSIKSVQIFSSKMQLRVGESAALSVVGIDESGKALDLVSEGLQIQYVNDNTAALNISEDGSVQGIANGTSNIKAIVEVNGKVFETGGTQIIVGPYFSISPVKLMDDTGKTVTALNPRGVVNASIHIINSQEKKQTVVFVVALFNKHGFVKSAKGEAIVNKYGNAEVTATLYLPDEVEGYYIKTFIWDGLSTMKPLVPAARVLG